MDDKIAAIRARRAERKRIEERAREIYAHDPEDVTPAMDAVALELTLELDKQWTDSAIDTLLDHIDQHQTALQRETDWHNQVAEIVEGIVAKHMGGQPDPETTPTLDLLRAIDAGLEFVQQQAVIDAALKYRDEGGEANMAALFAALAALKG